MNTPPDIMTMRDAATYLRLAEQTLESWRRKQIGPPFVRMRRAVRYRKADLDAWLESQITAETTP